MDKSKEDWPKMYNEFKRKEKDVCSCTQKKKQVIRRSEVKV